GGAEKVLRPTRADGAEPAVAAFASPAAESAAIVGAIRAADVPLEQIAILCRTNARLTDFEEALHEAGLPFQGSSLLDRDAARQSDVGRRVAVAAAFDGDAAAFVADLRRRFDSGGVEARGVNLLTLHRAKGLEFDVVFIPRLEEKELPSRQARTPDEIDEER